MDSNVSRTLAELERKLEELERALRSATEDSPPAGGPPVSGDPHSADLDSSLPLAPESSATHAARAPAPPAPRLVDENIERARPEQPPPSGHEQRHEEAPPTNQPRTALDLRSPISPPPLTGAPPSEQAVAAPLPPTTREAAGSEVGLPPAPGPERKVEIWGEHRIAADVIEVEELVRFRERLEQVTRELVDEYSRIIAMRRPSSD